MRNHGPQCGTTDAGSVRVKRNTGHNTVPPRALQLKRAASSIDVSEMSMRRLIKAGHIKANRALRHYLIPIAELDRFLEEGN